MRAKHLLIPALAVTCLFAVENTDQLKEAEQKHYVEEKKTQSFYIPAGGVVRLKNSTGDLNIEAWDNPNVEITTILSTQKPFAAAARAKGSAELGKVKVSAERKGSELVITTSHPRHRGFPPSFPVGGATNFNLEYHISVPRNARLVIDHDVGAVNVDGVTGDIDAKLLQGEIMLHLPEDVPYKIDAKSDYGNVNSDFPGEKKRGWYWWSQSAFRDAPKPAQALKLRVGYGDIVLLRIRLPKYPDAAPAAQARSGL
jgi:hypothetical protein